MEKTKNNFVKYTPLFYLVSILSYVVLNDPAPKNINLNVAVTIFFLFLFSLPVGLVYFKKLIKKNKLELFLGIFFTYLLLNTLFFQENNFKQSFRDIAGFSYMLLPYIFLKLDKDQFSKILNFTCTVSLLGILIIISKNYLLMGEYKYIYLDDKHPFNDPIYIFGITYFTFFSYLKMKFFFKHWSVIFISTNIIYLNYVYYTFTASNRLTILVYLFTMTLILFDFILTLRFFKNFNEKFLIFYKNNKSLIFYSILVIILLLIFLLSNSINKVFSSRFIEIKDTIVIMKETYFNLLFGSGIGSKFTISFHTRPVGFTHIFIYYIFLKIGFFGFILFLLYFYELININKINFFNFVNFFEIKKENLIFLSSLILLFGGLFFYSYFKYLTFWIIIGLLINNKVSDNV